MKRNIAGQIIGCDMVTAADGSAFAGAVTCYVCGDNGTQTLGTVGAGVATSKGRGYFTYVPAQAETNFDQVAFTFIGTGAIPRTVELNTADEVWAIQTATLLASGSIGQRLAPIGFFTAFAGSTSQITFPGSASAVNDFYQDSMLVAVEGAGAGQTASLATYTGATKVGVFYDPVATAFDASTKFYLLAAAATGPPIPTVADITTGVWAALTSALTTAGSIGKYLLDSIVGIRAKTDPLVFTVANKLDVNLKAVNDDLTAAVNLGRAASGIYVGQVTGSPTTTSFVDSALPGAIDGHWNGSVCILLSPALKGAKSTVLTSSAGTHALALKSDEPLPAAPQVGDAYILV